MSKQQNIICDNCGKPVGARNFGVVDRLSNFYDLCSIECRKFFRQKPAPEKRPAPKTKPSMSSKKPATTARQIAKALRPSETQVSATIGGDLERTAVYQSRLQSGAVEVVKGRGAKEKRFYMQLCTAGTPDRIAANGLIVFFEVKKQGELPSDDQKRVISDLQANGALVFVVDNYEDYKFIRLQLNKRTERIKRIAAMIRELQSEIDGEILKFKEHKKK